MTQRSSLDPPSQARVAPPVANPFAAKAPPARANRVLAALPADEYQRLLAHLEPVHLPRGLTLHGAGDRESYLYFIAAGLVRKSNVMRDGTSGEVALTGREGVIGISVFLGGAGTPGQSVVLCEGFAYRLRADRVRSEFDSGGALPALLLRYTQALIAQTGQVAVCNRFHPLEQRLCRWLLSCLDRLPSNELAMTQEVIAESLGVRREGITATAGRLQETGVIECHRGHLAVLDRARLEALACECYAALRQGYDGLLRELRECRADCPQ